MPKAFLVAHIEVHDLDTYAFYAQASTLAQKKYGARAMARGGRFEVLEGPQRSRHVILEFDSLEKAQAYYASPEYQAARQHRIRSSEGEFYIVETAE
jgi:uncharacterized protein (DUF1330 family)